MIFDSSRDAVYRPSSKPVFEGFEKLPVFDPTQIGYCAANVWWLSQAAHLAYFEEADVDQQLHRVGWKLVRFFEERNLPAHQRSTEGFLATADRFAVLSFRGTESTHLPDLKSDAQLRLVALARGTRARVHVGFLKALDEVWGGVDEELARLAENNIPVWYTGHSLGAALATVAASRRPPRQLVTFGSPRVGDEGFSRTLEKVSVLRITNCCDGVAAVPPPVFYCHVGQQYHFDHAGRCCPNPSLACLLRSKFWGTWEYHLTCPWFRRKNVAARFLMDHAIVNYGHLLAHQHSLGGK